jgi:tetratricopeptide (TPR) repeat protein
MLSSLVDKSFLSHDPESGRLEVHELLRQYAGEQLAKSPQASLSIQEAHAGYFGEFMQRMWHDLKSSRQMLALAEVEADIENVRRAWRYYLDQRNVPQLWKFIKGLWYLHWIRWWNLAGMELFAGAVSALAGMGDDESVALKALAMAFQSYFMTWLGLAEKGYILAEESVAILERLDHPESLVLAYDCLGINAFFLTRYADEIEAIKKMLEIVTELDDKWLLAFTLFGAGMAAIVQEDYAQARQLAETNLKLCKEIGDEIGSTQPLIVLGHVAFGRGEFKEARDFYLRCMAMAQKTGFHYAIQTASKYMCKAALSLHEIEEAEKYLLQSLTITKEIGFVRDIVNLLYEFARLRVAHGDLEGAAELLALVIAHPASDLYRMLEGRIRDSAEQLLSQIESDLPPDVLSAALERGRNLDIDEVVDDLLAPHG